MLQLLRCSRLVALVALLAGREAESAWSVAGACGCQPVLLSGVLAPTCTKRI